MEMSTGRCFRKGLLLLAGLLFCVPMLAQDKQYYTVRDGKMVIAIPRTITPGALDSFVSRFGLQDLYLREFLQRRMEDSLRRQGWQVAAYNQAGFTITRPLDPIARGADRLVFADETPLAARFPVSEASVRHGVNRFRNKSFSFREDSAVVVFLRGRPNARQVMLAGSFNNWEERSLPMRKVDSGWIAALRLKPGKYWYKFIVDGQWMVDEDNALRENDGMGNTNSVFFRTNTVFTLPSHADARRVYLAGSFNNWDERSLPMTRTAAGWSLPLYLAPGTHTYKFIADGRWLRDERNAAKFPDGHGEFNSVIAISGTPHIFTLKGHTDARQVYVAGSFNSWRDFELPLQRTADGWALPYLLPPGNWEYKFRVDGRWIADPANPSATGNGGSILVIGPNHTFRFKGAPRARTVFLSGSFNGWSKDGFPMRREGDSWVLTVHLEPGKHLYKFVVDGQWILDPANKLWEQNEMGTGNSILWIE